VENKKRTQSSTRASSAEARRISRPETPSGSETGIASGPFALPFAALASANSLMASCADAWSKVFLPHVPVAREPQWTTAHGVALDLTSMRLRDFSMPGARANRQPATLVCAPYAVHSATIADFAPGHSLVEVLRECGLGRVHVTDWRSATPDMRFLSIDSYLAELNVAVDDLGPPVDLVGLCQGGWLALVYAARFPEKVRRLVLAGAPVDIAAGSSLLSRVALDTPASVFAEVVRLGEGRVLGQHVLETWGPALAAEEADRVLQIPAAQERTQRRALERRFRDWYAWTVDLPGTYYLQVVTWLYKENRIAAGTFVALGRPVALDAVRCPVFLLAARADELVAPVQLLAIADRVGTPDRAIETRTEPGGHLSLFLGADTLHSAWPRIARWLGRHRTAARPVEPIAVTADAWSRTAGMTK
jgi:poly(3-hydroxyalkanoate) synthetase